MSTVRIAAALALSCVAALAQAAVPETMRAAAIDHTGGPEAVTLHTVPVPAPGADEVLIALHTVGVGPWDSEVREHLYYWHNRRYPLILGVDGAGTVAAVGTQVRGFKVGEPVYAYLWDDPKGGFYAEYVAVPAKAVGHVPAGMSLRDAGAAAVTALTAQQGIDDALHLKAGETLIILGASGGVGTLAVQFAKLRGARVLAIASGEDGVSLVKRLGADAAVDGHHADIAATAHAFAPAGADALLALAGGDALERCRDALRPGGRVAYPTGVEPAPKARPGQPLVRFDAVAGPEQFRQLGEAILAAKLVVPIAAEYPLADAGKAQQRLTAGHVLGKIVLQIH